MNKTEGKLLYEKKNKKNKSEIIASTFLSSQKKSQIKKQKRKSKSKHPSLSFPWIFTFDPHSATLSTSQVSSQRYCSATLYSLPSTTLTPEPSIAHYSSTRFSIPWYTSRNPRERVHDVESLVRDKSRDELSLEAR